MQAPHFSVLRFMRRHFASLGDRDPLPLHWSDCVDCERAVAERRRGTPQLPFPWYTRVKFGFGVAAEPLIDQAVDALLSDGWTYRRDVACFVHGIQGHADRVFTHPTLGTVVGEIKSTTFKMNFKTREREPDRECKIHYILQAAGYAVALDAAFFFILAVCRESGKATEWFFNTDDYREQVQNLATIYKTNTDPQAALPPPIPPMHSQWRCRFCRIATCPKNANPAARNNHAVTSLRSPVVQ